ncbi:MAG: O-antigen ligase family protein [Chloroflexi bacterium]|nr:O-antigen ligase family protein [Chloroflexota bacterium]
MRRNASTASVTGYLTGIRTWLGRGIEAAWLIAAVVTPLIVLSEDAFLSKTELPKVATVRIAAGATLIFLLADAGLIAWRRGISIPPRPYLNLDFVTSLISRIRGDAGARVVASVAVLLVTTALATAFALIPRLSTWGPDPGAESYSLYSTASYAVLFFAVATRVRTPSQVWRLIAAIVGVGALAALVGMAQHFEYAPFGIRSTSGSSRVSGTAGNPIFFAAILAVTFTLAAGISLSIRGRSARAAIWYSLYGLVAFVHITALLITLSRGPWIAVAASMFAIAILAPWVFGWRRTIVTGLLTIVAIIASLVFLSVTNGLVNPAVSSQPVTGDTADPADQGARGEPIVDEIRVRATTFTEVFDPVANLRFARWKGAIDLASERPQPPVGNERGMLIRSLFGYGPDTFPDVFPMVAPSRLADVRSPAAHNEPLNRLVETGLVGLLAWSALWASLVYLLLGNLWRNRGRGGAGQAVTLAVGVALIAWFVAGLTGIPRSGDSVLFWLIAGLAVATARVFKGEENGHAVKRAATPKPSGAIRASAVIIITLMAITVTWLTWTQTVQRLRADASAAVAASPGSEGKTIAERLADIDRAIFFAPDVPRYHAVRSDLYQLLSVQPGGNPIAALREAVASAERALALNPLDRDLNFRAAFLDWELAGTGDMDAALRTHAIYQRLDLLTPQHPEVRPRLDAVAEALGFGP